MKKIYILAFSLLMGLAVISCSDSDDNGGKDPANIEYSQDNANSWHNYMINVARLLKQDSENLYNAWAVSYKGKASYGETFKNHNGGDYTSAVNCIEQLIDGCVTIADEVGTAKIGDPYQLYISGNTTEALYAVESWYSWHSREDYRNNIYSIRNSYFGSTNGSINDASLAKAIAASDSALNNKVIAAINKAANAIWAIPQPFRNNIDSREAEGAMEACAELSDMLNNKLKPAAKELSEEVLSPIAANYVDVVVIPTYKALYERNKALLASIEALAENPTDEGFKAACEAWLEARQPWEESEAFLFGPVDAEGLDPNMDSWPLDQNAIVQLLESGNWDEMNWDEEDDDAAIEEAQSVRGFHTLEFLLFKDGNPRKAN